MLHCFQFKSIRKKGHEERTKRKKGLKFKSKPKMCTLGCSPGELKMKRVADREHVGKLSQLSSSLNFLRCPVVLPGYVRKSGNFLARSQRRKHHLERGGLYVTSCAFNYIIRII